MSLVRSVLETLDAADASERPTFVQRIFPVQTTCEPVLSDITAALRTLLTTAVSPQAICRCASDGPAFSDILLVGTGRSGRDSRAVLSREYVFCDV